jgi:aspartate kinase
MARIVAKFGGTSVADLGRIERVADKVAAEWHAGHEIAVVVSAMAGVTEQLVEWVRAVGPLHDAREYDVVVSTGEQVTAGLIALALQQRSVPARSWLGWQLPINTDTVHAKARIDVIGTEEVCRRFVDRREVPVVPGFQGFAPENGRVTTLGRGGSDTSAVALAAALTADRCDIYTDVDGVYTADPRIVDRARRMGRITYEEMLELASVGAKVLQTRSVALAMANRVPLQVLSSFDEALGSSLPGTMVVDESQIMEQEVVSGIAHSRDEAKITLFDVPDRPGIAATIFGPLTEAAINVDMIVQNISEDGRITDITFTTPRGDFERTMTVLEANQAKIGYHRISASTKLAKVSVVGVGMRSHAGVAQRMFKTLAERSINILVITTSEIKISVLIDDAYTELAVRALHKAYGLDAD